MKIIIIGAAGFLGTKLMKTLSENHEVIGADINGDGQEIYNLDATKLIQTRTFLFEHKPDIVIDTVALTSSLACEKDPELAEKLIYLTAKNIADACREIGSIMIFISSTYTFDGEKGDYKEEDVQKPLNIYGVQKIKAEKEVLKLKNSIVFRIDIMYGYNGKNKPNGAFDRILSGKMMGERSPNQLRQPLFVEDVGRVIIRLVEKDQSGIFNLAGLDKITNIDFYKKLEKLVREESKIKVIRDENMLVKSPHNATLDISKLEKLGIRTHSLDQALEIMKTQISPSQ
ncbi:SDR family oxidoreductase [Nanoarchaeota archaeon]